MRCWSGGRGAQQRFGIDDQSDAREGECNTSCDSGQSDGGASRSAGTRVGNWGSQRRGDFGSVHFSESGLDVGPFGFDESSLCFPLFDSVREFSIGDSLFSQYEHAFAESFLDGIELGLTSLDEFQFELGALQRGLELDLEFRGQLPIGDRR